MIIDIKPQNGKTFSLKELQGYVGGTIDIQELPKMGALLVLNDNGKCEGLPENPVATILWKMNYPIKEYPENNDELVVGDVVICTKNYIK